MLSRVLAFSFASVIALPSVLPAAHPLGFRHSHSAAGDSDAVDLWTGKGVKLANFLTPGVSFLTTFGTSSADDPATLAVGHHDPDRKGFTIQNVEFTLGAELGKHVSAFALYAAKVDLDDHWDDQFEEFYVSVHQLPAELRLRGGRFYAAFGYQNTLHPHDFEWADQYLANGRLLGEDALTLYGGEVSAPLPWNWAAGWSDRLTVAYGAIPDAEDDEHGHGGHGEIEPLFEPEGARLQDWAAVANYTVRYDYNEHHHYEGGLSAAIGRNEFQRQTQLAGLHFTYAWFEKGPDEPGRSLVWRNEVMVRHFGARSSANVHEGEAAHEEEGHGTEEHADETEPAEESAAHDDEHEEPEHAEEEEHEPEVERPRHNRFTDAGFYSSLAYGFSDALSAHVRAEYVSGVDDTGLDERWRLSPGITWRPSSRWDVQLRVQYNYDHSSSFGEEHTIWSQVKIGWGGGHE